MWLYAYDVSIGLRYQRPQYLMY